MNDLSVFTIEEEELAEALFALVYPRHVRDPHKKVARYLKTMEMRICLLEDKMAEMEKEKMSEHERTR
jgi:hypothetical protein